MVKVKICGITRPEDAQAAAGYGADYLGMIFAPSPRKLTLKSADTLRVSIPDFDRWVAVFVNQDYLEIINTTKKLGISFVQLHGDETPEFCQLLERQGITVIKAFSIRNQRDIAQVSGYQVSHILFDSYLPGQRGGTGKRFDWQLLKELQTNANVFVSGGLTAESVPQVLRNYVPHALDVSSGVEDSPGIKNSGKIKDFIEMTRKYGHG